MISVIMSTYNEPKELVCEAIESILKQDYSDIEFIIVVDNPANHEMIDIIEEYQRKDARVSVHINSCNMGLAQSLNIGISKSHGEYIARMDADDISFVNRISCELKYLRSNELDMVFSTRINISENGEFINEYKLPMMKSDMINKILEYDCIVTHPSVLIRSDVIKKNNGYRKLDVAQDYDLWLRLMSANYRIGCINEPLIFYRKSKNALSAQKAYMQFITAEYVKQLYKQRKKVGGDNYSYENYQAYLKKKGVFDPAISSLYNNVTELFYNGLDEIKNGKFLKGIYDVLKSLKGNEWTIMRIKKILMLKLVWVRYKLDNG